MADIDWDVLRAAAIDARSHAYVPYSKFPVGVAALVDDGRIVTGRTSRTPRTVSRSARSARSCPGSG